MRLPEFSNEFAFHYVSGNHHEKAFKFKGKFEFANELEVEIR